jgi:RNA polymerase sigma-70 factor, ECF subfamily
VSTPTTPATPATSRPIDPVTPTLTQFFQETFPVIQRKCARMLGDGDEAADVAQETFLRLVDSAVVHEPPGVRLAWIYRTSTNLAIDRLRRRRLGVEVRADERVFAGPDVAGHPSLPEATLVARQRLHAVAARLGEDELRVIIMTRLDDMTQEEVASVLAISPRTVRRLLARAQSTLDGLDDPSGARGRSAARAGSDE